VHISRYPRDAIGVIHKFVTSFLAETVVRVYAVGGDGILFDCLNGIVGLPNTELAIMPYGISNDFLSSFGEENAPQFRDIAKQVKAGTIKTDILCCGSNYAMNFCSVGVEAASILYTLRLLRIFDRAIRLSRRVVPFLYAVGGVFAILNKRYREQRYRISLDGERVDGDYTTVNIANGPYYGGGMCAAAEASPNDGFMDALFLKKGSALRILRMLPQYLRGGYLKYPAFFNYNRVRRVEISSDALLTVNLDGEMFFDTNITVEIIPQAVDVVAVDALEYRSKAGAGGRAAPVAGSAALICNLIQKEDSSL
jgi:diacylglycerol kinase family enzyme